MAASFVTTSRSSSASSGVEASRTTVYSNASRVSGVLLTTSVSFRMIFSSSKTLSTVKPFSANSACQSSAIGSCGLSKITVSPLRTSSSAARAGVGSCSATITTASKTAINLLIRLLNIFPSCMFCRVLSERAYARVKRVLTGCPQAVSKKEKSADDRGNSV